MTVRRPGNGGSAGRSPYDPLAMREMAWARRVAWAVLLAGLVFVLGNGRVGLWDRDEPRYAQTSKQMLLSDPPDWVVPRFLGAVRTAKPIFIYWCQAVSMKLVGVGEFGARLPSAVAMTAVLGVLGVSVGRIIGWRRAFWTVFVLGSSGLALAAGKMCITDGVLLLWITIAQLCLLAIYAGRSSWWVVMWVAIGLAVLTKGPVVIAVQVSTVIALAALDVGRRDWRFPAAWRDRLRWVGRTRPLWGLLIVAAIAAPWLIAIQVKAPEFLRTTITHDVLTRATKPLEGHKGPPGFYLLTVWGTYFPWCLLLPTTVTMAWKNRRLAPVRFAIAAVVGPWVVMELVQTKLPHYVLPAWPFMAFLTGDAIVRCVRRQFDDLHRPVFVWAAAAWAIVVVGLGFVPWLAMRRFEVTEAYRQACVAFCVVGVVYAGIVFALFKGRMIGSGALALGFGMWVVVAVAYAWLLPAAGFLWLPQRVATVLHRHGATNDVMMIDYKEDSLAYYQGGTIRAGEESYFTEVPEERWARWVVTSREWWEKQPSAVKGQYEVVGSERGVAYAARGRVLEVLVVRKR